MKSTSPRLRMFAGPNGSGKSSIKDLIKSKLVNIYINPDEIEKEIKQSNFLDLTQYGITTTQIEILDFFGHSTLLEKAGLILNANEFKFIEGKLYLNSVRFNSYFASVTADFIRQKLLQQKKSFTFETVMSSPDKIDILKQAQNLGYRTYLYFVATENPIINISRVKNRVANGGHNVPENKIIDRYYRSLNYLMDAIKNTNRAYIFDNSGSQLQFIAEITDGNLIGIKTNDFPAWFKEYVLDKTNQD